MAKQKDEMTVVQMIDPAISKRIDDNDRIRELNAEFRNRIKTDPLVTFKPPKFYRDILGSVYAFTFNNEDVVVRFDGTPQKFPQTIYDMLMEKLALILDSNTPYEEYTDL